MTENTETIDIEALKEKNKQLEKEIFMTKAEAEINTAIAMARPRNLAAAKVMLDKNGVLTENGIDSEILSKNLAKLKESDPWLFENSNGETKLFSTGMSFGFGELTDPAMISDDEYYKKIMK